MLTFNCSHFEQNRLEIGARRRTRHVMNKTNKKENEISTWPEQNNANVRAARRDHNSFLG